MFSTHFAQRLTDLLTQKHISQSQLAQRLGVSRSTITGWLRYGKLPDAELLAQLCTVLKCSADWLLGLAQQPQSASVSGKIRWIEQLPANLPDTQRQQLEYGVRLFNLFLRENQSAAEVNSRHNAQDIRAALQAVLRSSAIRLTHVARDTELENRLKEMYPTLKDVIVASVPERYDNTLLRTEFVAYLAAVDVLAGLSGQSAVGLGVGYTLLRLCELSLPGINQFNGTRWVPLVAFNRQDTLDYSANFLAKLMSTRHPGSRALHLAPDYAETFNVMRNLPTIFTSVSGVDRRDRSGKAYPFAEFRSADYDVESPFLRAEYERLADKNTFGGEFLRYLLNERGEIIGRDPAVNAQIDLDLLRYHTEMIGKVYIVAACRFKAKAVQTCIEKHLANALVIDSEIAEQLLIA